MSNRLIDRFRETFPGVSPVYSLWVPGRVNLIGEHTDYNGLPVMPMAIARGIHMLIAPSDGHSVQLRNVAEEFEPLHFTMSADIKPYPTGNWGNYVKAGVQSIVCSALKTGMGMSDLRGFCALVDSTLPIAAGLSSSSAMVVASALATASVNNLPWERTTLAEQMAAAERYVGTMGGGMDQAVILLAQAGAALKIDFYPLRTTTVSLPSGYSVVICNSMVQAPKTAEARLSYNRLPIECHMAAAMLSHALRDKGVNESTERISDLLKAMTAEQLMDEAERLFGQENWDKKRVAAHLGITIEELEERYMRLVDGDTLPTPPEGFPLLKRVRHVVSEAKRVENAAQVLEASDAVGFGELMNASHTSCRDDYGISCPELDQLVEIARSAGAVGSRLTGAGFGGCTVSLVSEAKLDAFQRAVIEGYYEGYLQEHKPYLHQEVLKRGYDDVIVISTPQSGADVKQL